ncbi:unnamed protein product [Owenia fusiformis]|uniref:Protein-lysine N-methyltransferase SMYD4 n=1 Tax=Owenia fusiformis TaxID=6347 RepID=A0A8J1U384_OWEFU|nr:unnamed protein product [Owenia fusiformis]
MATIAHESGGFFEALFADVCKTITGKGLQEQLSCSFASLESDEERAKFILDCDVIIEKLQAKERYSGKDVEKSLKFRSEGNKLYQKQLYGAALEHYNMSVLYAPSPVAADGECNSELSLALANRSAVLYHTKRYHLCIIDIEEALESEYPIELKYKLFDRKAKCFESLYKHNSALDSFDMAVEFLANANIDEKKKVAWKRDIDQHMVVIKKKQKGPLHSYPDMSEKPLPTVSYGQNDIFPAASKAFDVSYRPDCGRFATASEDIRVGDVMIVDKPFASVLLPTVYRTHCYHCMKRVVAAIPCTQCSAVKFCTFSCRKEAWSYHQVECKFLKFLLESGVGKFGLLALRTILKAGWKFLKEYKSVYHSGEELDPSMLGFDEYGFYANDYNAIINLVTHAEDREPSDLFRRGVMAIFLLKVLQSGGFFSLGVTDSTCKDSVTPTPDDLAYVGGLLLSHIQLLPCNAHEITELGLTDDIATSHPVEIGAGIYSHLSLLNHSCDPAVNRNYYGDVCVVRAIRNVPKGEEISDNYGAVYAVHNKAERHEKLQPQYFFSCECEACIFDWPLYFDIENKVPTFKCDKCSTPIPLPTGCINNPNTKPVHCSECHHPQNLTAKSKILKRATELFSVAMDKMLKGEVESALPTLENHLFLLDKLICRPWREINNCQEAIKQCYSIMGNCHRLESKCQAVNNGL